MLARLFAFVLAVATIAAVRPALAQEAPVKAVVFVPPLDIEAPLRDALTAQLSGTAAELVVEHFVSANDSLRQNVEESRSMAAAHQAIGVFWLDSRSKEEWLVYLAEPVGNRVLMRRVPIGPDGSVAAMEAVAVIVRESTSALLAGRKIGMTEVEVPAASSASPPPPPPFLPPPPPRVVPPPPPRTFLSMHGVSLSASFYVDHYAKSDGLSSGVGLAASWNFAPALRVGASYVVFSPADADAAGLVFLVRRYPIGLEAMYSYVRENWLLGFGVRGTAELTSRHVVAALPPAQPTADTQRAVVFLSPRLRFDYRVSEAMSLFLAGGADFALNGFSFVNRVDGVDRPVFEPLRVRPAGEVGAVFWP